ncbi:DUF6933 domain-containing protein [Demequina sp.]|uniref:DUF6933 domain-containing protein n=1 Tax=Demequina sp. TaxID=2050685 RepID=UPI003D0BC134
MNDLTLHLHATAPLAKKIGGFTEQGRVTEPALLDTWYATLIRRRRPRVIAVNPNTLATVIVSLAPAAAITQTLLYAIGEHLAQRGAPAGFAEEHVPTLGNDSVILKTADRRMVGILNRRVLYTEQFALEGEDQWESIAHWMTDDLTSVPGGGYVRGADLLADAFKNWERGR